MEMKMKTKTKTKTNERGREGEGRGESYNSEFWAQRRERWGDGQGLQAGPRMRPPVHHHQHRNSARGPSLHDEAVAVTALLGVGSMRPGGTLYQGCPAEWAHRSTVDLRQREWHQGARIQIAKPVQLVRGTALPAAEMPGPHPHHKVPEMHPNITRAALAAVPCFPPADSTWRDGGSLRQRQTLGFTLLYEWGT